MQVTLSSILSNRFCYKKHQGFRISGIDKDSATAARSGILETGHGTAGLDKTIDMLGGRVTPKHLHERTLLTPPHYAWLKIAEGCSRTCSFCGML